MAIITSLKFSGSLLGFSLFDERVNTTTFDLSDDDLDVYVYEGETIQICGVVILANEEIDSDLDVIIQLELTFPKKQLDAGTYGSEIHS